MSNAISRKTKKQITLLVVVLVIVGGIGYALYYSKTPAQLDGFAKCLKEKSVIFYGAFWCPHCQNQKALFGSSKQYLPYVECSLPDAKGQNDLCTAQGIKGYPTWQFADGSRESREMTLQELSEKSGCVLPK
jgi:thiol-disulfide isomerase/thioredoxin